MENFGVYSVQTRTKEIKEINFTNFIWFKDKEKKIK